MNIHRQENGTKGEKLAQRLSSILALLHQGDHLDKHLLAPMFSVDVRTIERDLTERLQGIVERNTDGSWQLMQASRGTVPAKYLNEYASMVGTQHLFPDTSLRYVLSQLRKKDDHRPTWVQPAALEDLEAGKSQFSALESAIEQRLKCQFEYKDKVREVQPYRLIHKYGIWYLAAVESDRLKTFSVALVTGLRVDSEKSFDPDPVHHDYLDSRDDIWFAPQTTETILRVAPGVSRYFTRRALLPKQQHRTDNDGSLIVTCEISHPQQLLPVVRYWMPHVRIVRPTQWHAQLVAELKEVLDLWDPSTSVDPSVVHS